MHRNPIIIEKENPVRNSLFIAALGVATLPYGMSFVSPHTSPFRRP